MAKVDVIIPFYDTPIEYTREALESVLAQTYSDWAAVVVNDGSSEKSTGQLETLMRSFDDPRIIHLKAEHRGIAATRNTGIRRLDGPYIALLDSDDLWLPSRLEKTVPILDKNPQIDMVHANADVIDPSGRIVLRAKSRSFLNSLTPDELLIQELQKDFVQCPTVLFRRSAAEAAGLFDESFPCVQDKMLWIRMLGQRSAFFYLDETIAFHRRHAANISKNTEKLMKGRFLLIQRVEEMIESNPSLQHLDWKKLKKQMLRHLYQEASEGFLAQMRCFEALKYSLPFYSGLRLETTWLTVRSTYRMVVPRRSQEW